MTKQKHKQFKKTTNFKSAFCEIPGEYFLISSMFATTGRLERYWSN